MDNFWILRKSNEHFADFIIHKLQPWIHSPEIIFKKSVSNRLLWNLISTELALNAQANFILADKGPANAIVEKRPYFDQFSDRWYEIKAFPEVLSRKIEEARNLDLSFVSDPELRALIIDDYSEAKRTFAGKNYKSTIILCGSIAEALLTDALDRHRPTGITTTQLYKSDLAPLIDLAISNGLIKDTNLKELITPIRKYRNLIHPGVQLRKDLTPDESKAAIALAVIEILVKELT